jgi:mono/diheme cytochrome c family protein
MVACSGEKADESTAYGRGQILFRNICVACHNADPTQEGPIGPVIAKAPLELLRAKVLRGEYPEGHTPKRNTKQMPPLPYLEPHLPDLVAFLAGREG